MSLNATWDGQRSLNIFIRKSSHFSLAKHIYSIFSFMLYYVSKNLIPDSICLGNSDPWSKHLHVKQDADVRVFVFLCTLVSSVSSLGFSQCEISGVLAIV